MTESSKIEGLEDLNTQDLKTAAAVQPATEYPSETHASGEQKVLADALWQTKEGERRLQRHAVEQRKAGCTCPNPGKCTCDGCQCQPGACKCPGCAG